ncbi:MAG: tetratricopeptide repeat protein [Saprospiraceae bacterium]|nr:tetratricopeptide repeat protein [Saprospiraceae bacterium]
METQELLQNLEAAFHNKNANLLEDLAREAVVTTPTAAYGYYFLAEANWLKEKYQNAEICIAKAIELEASNVAYILRLAHFKETQQEWDNARLLYSKTLDIDTENILALAGLARYAMNEASDYEQALEYLDQALRIRAENTELLRWRAIAYENLGNPKAALEDIKAILEQELTEDALILQLNATLALEDSDLVLAAYQQLIDFATDNLDHIMSLGNYLLDKERYAEAEERFLFIKEKLGDQYNTSLYGVLALSLVGQEKYEEALAIFATMLAQDATDADVYIERAKVHQQMGNIKEAIKDLRQASTYVSELAKMDLFLQEAHMRLDLGDVEGSKKLYKKLMKDEVYAADAYFGLAQVLQKEGNTAQAFKAAMQAHKLGHRQAKDYAYEHFGEELAKQEKTLLAKYADLIAANAENERLKPYFGSFCSFDIYKNKLGAGIPEELAKKLLESLADTALILTAKGLILINPIEKRSLAAVYRIVEEDGDELEIEIIPLDGSSSYNAILTLNGNAIELEPQTRKAKNVALNVNKAQGLSSKYKKLIQKYLKATDLDFLGEDVEALKKVVF